MRTLFLDLGFPLLLVAVVAWSVSAYAETVWGTNFGVVVGTNKIVIHDFASHLNFAKAFWRGEGGYSVDDHLRMTARFAGERLPFGYSPTMLWILAPLCPLPTAWGFFAWTLLGLVAVLWLSRRYRSVLVAASFISPGARHHGQRPRSAACHSRHRGRRRHAMVHGSMVTRVDVDHGDGREAGNAHRGSLEPCSARISALLSARVMDGGDATGGHPGRRRHA